MVIEPKRDEFDEVQTYDSKPRAESYVDAVRMRITTWACFALVIYIFFQVIF
mgnify:CR=1 FL=1